MYQAHKQLLQGLVPVIPQAQVRLFLPFLFRHTGKEIRPDPYLPAVPQGIACQSGQLKDRNAGDSCFHDLQFPLFGSGRFSVTDKGDGCRTAYARRQLQGLFRAKQGCQGRNGRYAAVSQAFRQGIAVPAAAKYRSGQSSGTEDDPVRKADPALRDRPDGSCLQIPVSFILTTILIFPAVPAVFLFSLL